MSLDPHLKKFLRIGLIGTGALAVMSAIVNIVGAWQLIDASAEESLGITRSEWVSTYVVILLVGAALIYAGLRWKK
jgi:hypothetical protein